MKNNAVEKIETGIMLEDYIADYNHKEPRVVCTPFNLYNSYLMAANKLGISEDNIGANQSVLNTSGTIFSERVRFYFITELKGYCDYIKMISPKDDNCIYRLDQLYYELISEIYEVYGQILSDRNTFMDNIVGGEAGSIGFVFSMAAVVFNRTIEAFYPRINVTDKLYKDITVANMIFVDNMENIVRNLYDEFHDIHKPVITQSITNLDNIAAKMFSIED